MTFGTRVAGAGAAFILNIALARVLDIASAGYFFVSLSLVTIVYALARLGLGYSTYRFTAEICAKNEQSLLKDLSFTVLSIVAATSLLSFALVSALAQDISTNLFKSPEMYRCLQIMAISIPLYCIGSIASEVLKGLGRPLQYSIFESFIIKAFAIPLIIVFGTMYGISGAAWAFVAANLVGLIFVGFCFFSAIRAFRWHEGPKKIHKSELYRATVYFSVVSLSTVLSQWAGPLIVGHLIGARETAIFYAAFRTAAVLDLIVISIGAVSGPLFVKAYIDGGTQALKLAALKTSKTALAGAIALSIPLVIWAPQVMLIYGKDFAEGAFALRIFLVAQWVNAPLGIFGIAVIAAKRERTMAALAPAATLIGLLVTYLLTSRYGLIGASIGVAFTTLVYNTLLSISFLAKKQGIN
jgi:O-antigen/teichoic acid export membrane protein